MGKGKDSKDTSGGGEVRATGLPGLPEGFYDRLRDTGSVDKAFNGKTDDPKKK